jgi:TPR repeat protein
MKNNLISIKTVYFSIFVVLFATMLMSCAVETQRADQKFSEKPEEVFRAGLASYDIQNYEVAFAKWLSLAKRGHAESAFRIAEMYDFAQGVPQNYKKAARWYLEAAERGHGEAQCNIASRYDGGPGIRRNKLKAYKWYWLCLHNKEASETAKYNADIHLNAYFAVGVLSMKQIKKAESQARAWQPKPSLHLEGLPDN